ncbi:MAG: Y-family DNA polymerase, partial [Actinomycetes bacterium]
PRPMTPRRILLADADAFFVAVARMADPEGAGRAPLLIVGGRPNSRGVVCSASYETRAYGVRSAMPIAQALRLCPDALCVPVPRAACTTTSRAIGAVLQRFTPVVQAASIDEWYLDLSGTEALYAPESFEQTAQRIRATVHHETGIWLSLGGGTSKLIAKLAAEKAKPRAGVGGNGVHLVPEGYEATFMRGCALAEIPGVGPKLQTKLASLGLERVPDVLAVDPQTLGRWLGTRPAAWLRERCLGRHEAPVEGRAPAKQVSRETTFDRDIRDVRAIAVTLRSLATRVASELRTERLAARTITVKIKDADFTTRLASTTVADPVESDRAIADLAIALLARLRKARTVPARLIGVSCGGLVPRPDAEQLGLFAPPARGTVASDAAATAPVPAERPEDRAVSRAVDRVRERFGNDAIRYGV